MFRGKILIVNRAWS